MNSKIPKSVAITMSHPEWIPQSDVVMPEQIFVDVARDLKIRSIQHKNYVSISEELTFMGLKIG